jgi:hypothetical protein
VYVLFFPEREEPKGRPEPQPEPWSEPEPAPRKWLINAKGLCWYLEAIVAMAFESSFRLYLGLVPKIPARIGVNDEIMRNGT